MKKGFWAVSPLLVFLAVYLVSSIVAGDFYRVPVSAAFLLAAMYAVLIAKGPLRQRIECFGRGAGHPNLLLMVWIFILAGAFAGTAKDIGSVDATVNATLAIMPPRMLFAGLFVTASFISMSVGTSVGTIVALVPIGAGIAQQCGIDLAYVTGIIVGGSFFGDNLSFISDTTIAATRAAGCEMRDKFRTNLLIVLPAVLLVGGIYLLQGHSLAATAAHEEVNLLKMLPYLLVILLALLGMDVCIVLSLGIAACAAIGFATGSFGWVGWLESVGRGIAGMSELIIVTLLAGGLLEMIRTAGGLDWISGGLSKMARGPRGAQLCIAALVGLTNVCTANNTIAIITSGGIAKDIADRFGIDPRKTASLLDTFSCLVQGVLPYGAQLLMAAGLAGLTPAAIIPKLYYPMIMGCCALLSIVFDFPRRRTA